MTLIYYVYSITGLPANTTKAIQSSHLQCSSQGDVCQFPVNVSGVLHWKCQDRNGVKVCNTKPPQSGSDIQIFNNTDSFEPCEKCNPECIRSQHYGGFPLKNSNEKNDYKEIESESDCQQLCQATDGCNFFNYDSFDKACWLKYGIGKRKLVSSATSFGPKFCPGN